MATFRQRVFEFLQEHEPTRAQFTDSLVSMYEGREEHLMAILRSKYGDPADPAESGGTPVRPTTASGVSEPTEPDDSVLIDVPTHKSDAFE